MPSERAARLKATKQRVFISGIEGSHTLEVGVAYHYRGHFIYAYPAGNPIEPIPFSTKKGINIVGLVQDRAPIFNSQEPHLKPESEIAALQRACLHEQEFQKEQKEAKKEETKKTLEEEAKQEAGAKVSSEEEIETAAAQERPSASLPLSRVPSFTTLLVPSQVTSRYGSQASLDPLPAPAHKASASLSNVPRIGTVEAPEVPSASAYAGPGTSYTPHDRGHYLAYSAPGSRHTSVDNTPFVSRSVSPTHGLSVRGYGHSALLRPNASTSRLNQLLAEGGFRHALSPLAEDRPSRRQSGSGALDEDMVANLSVAQGWIDPDDIDAFVKTVSRKPSRPSSRPLSRMKSPGPISPDEEMDDGLFLPGLGHPDVIQSTSKNPSRSHSPMPPSVYTSNRMGSGDQGSNHAGSRPPSRPYSPVPSPNYDSAESVAYLCGLSQHHYEMENPPSRSRTPLPPATEDTHYLRGGGGIPLYQSTRSHTPGEDGRHGSTQLDYFSRRGSVQPSRTHSPVQQQQAYPHDLDQRGATSTSAFPTLTSTFPASVSRAPSPTVYVPAPLNTGRPRAASVALNEAYNAANPPAQTPRPLIQPNTRSVFTFPNESSTDTEHGDDTETGAEGTNARDPKCAIHGGTCDGKTVTGLRMTERAVWGKGFVESVPTIKGEGEELTIMVDWARIMDEERAKMRREGLYPLA
jgi:hypothetical protein